LGKIKPESDVKNQELLKQSGVIPAHIAIIMDGNGRWAKKRGLPRVAGHKRGVDSVKDIVKACAQVGVKHLTLYTFSTENWKRPKDEVSTLMRLLVRSLRNEAAELDENDIRLTTIGDVESLPSEVQKELLDAVERTKNNKKMNLNLALSYSGRWEIIEAVKKIALNLKAGEINLNEISENSFAAYLTTKNIPDPDLIIRTSGEFRVSNFLLWQIAYSEFYITEFNWPDFRRKHLYEAIRNFQQRERRFGKVSEQLTKNDKGTKNVANLPKEIA
jgi:undecaprenyl diphosphate synthase